MTHRTPAPLHRMTDAALMRRAQDADAVAFGVIVDRYSALVQHHARSFTRAGAEDIAQQAFLSAWMARHRYDPARGSVHGWLCGIARNRAIDHHRRDRRRVVQAPIQDTVHELVCPAERPAEIADRRAQASEVRRAVARLGPEQRTVIALAYFAGLSQSEIQQRTNAPLGTVKSRARLALATLRAELPAAA
jgi:RNA polymerase sigma-70 factor (ECF subfamily)